MRNSVRVLVIGVGGMGREHLQRLMAIDKVRIAVLVDTSRAAIAAARGLSVARVTEAAWQSAQLGRPVMLAPL